MSKPMSIDPKMTIYTANAEEDHKRLTELCRKLSDAGDVAGLGALGELMIEQGRTSPYLLSKLRLAQMPMFYMETALNNLLQLSNEARTSKSDNANTLKPKTAGKKTYLVPRRLVPKYRY